MVVTSSSRAPPTGGSRKMLITTRRSSVKALADPQVFTSAIVIRGSTDNGLICLPRADLGICCE